MIRHRRQLAGDEGIEPIADLPLFPDALVTDELVGEPSEKAAGSEPLARSVGATGTERPSGTARKVEQVALPIERPAESASSPTTPPAHPTPMAARTVPTPLEHQPASLAKRCMASLVDMALMVGVLGVLLGGGYLLGAPSGMSHLGFYLPTWLLFAFLYHVVPLVFWGRTPGMAYAGIIARGCDGGTMTGAQAMRRWLAGVATLLLLGLPGLAALGGRSLADRASGTTTLAAL